MSNIFDHLVDHNRELAIALVVMALVAMIAARKLGGRPLAEQFPRVAAVSELVLGPLTAIVIGSLLRVAAPYLGFDGIDQELRTLTVIATYAVGTLVIARVIDVFYLSGIGGSVRDQVPGLLRALFYLGCALIGAAIYFKVHGYAITGVWVSTGVIAALAGFALQKTLGDLFSGIALSIERPFRLGDWLELTDGTVGQVIDMNWRATRLRGWDNATYVIPNGELAGQNLKNLHGPAHPYAPWYLVRIPSDVDPRLAKALLLEAALKCNNVLKDPLPVVRITDASTIPYTYMVWVHFRNYPAMFAGREELFREVHYALKNAGIQVAPEISEWRARRAMISRAEPPSILLALKALDVTSDWTDDQLEQIASASQYLNFDAGTVILREGDVAEALDVIVNGIVGTSVTLPDGVHRDVDRLYPGQYFGITSMTMAEPSVLQFCAVSDVTLIHVNIDCIRSLIAAYPHHADRLAAIVKQRMDAAEQVRAASRRPVPSLTFHEVLRRLEHSLMGQKRR